MRAEYLYYFDENMELTGYYVRTASNAGYEFLEKEGDVTYVF